MRILTKQILCDCEQTRIIKMQVLSPALAKKAKPGQFVVLMVKPEGERIPLTVMEANSEGAITLVFQELGFTTKLLGTLEPGNELYSIVGPLGHPTRIQNYGNVVIIGGGVGIAEIYPVARALKEKGNHIHTILGSRTKDMLVLEDELRGVSDELSITTNDGSYGVKGFTTDVLKEILKENKVSLIYAVGPIPMMRAVSMVSKEYNVKTMVSLNALMVDGTGMCGCCRVTVNNKVMFSCVDGPEFDGHQVDWAELTKRNSIYVNKEKHICKLGKI